MNHAPGQWAITLLATSLRSLGWIKRARSARESTIALQIAACLALTLLTPLWAQAQTKPSFLTTPSFPTPLAHKAPLLAAAVAGDRLVAAGDFGTVLLSDDAGKTWRQAKTPTRATLSALFFLDAKRGWAAGHGGVLIATRDGGESWTQLANLGANTVPFALRFSADERGWVVGAFGYAASSPDGGKSWQTLRVSTGEFADQHLYAMFSGPGQRLWITAEGGSLYFSDDAGASFRALALPYKGSIWGGLALDDHTILVWGMRGKLLKSIDGGKTWNEVASGTDQALTAGVLRGREVVLAGLGGAITRSSDGGNTFQATTRPARQAHSALLEAKGALLTFTLAGIGGAIE